MPDRAPSLSPMIECLKRIKLFQTPFWMKHSGDGDRVIVIAGTNGKGSVSATLESLVFGAGETVGLYTSPHLVHTTERIRLNTLDISREHFCQTHDAVLKLIGDLTLTHFEMLTAMAIWYFCSGEIVPPVDRIILEVGLGGLWDATNAVPHGLCAITSLGLDHQNFLGNTITEVARNKFGIVTENSKVIHQRLPDETVALAEDIKNKTRSHWSQAKILDYRVETLKDEPTWYIETKWGDTPIKLPGLRGVQNTSLAIAIFETLGLSEKNALNSIANVRWPGRMERVVYQGHSIYLSGDHNPQGVDSLLELLPYYKYQRLHLLLGIGKDKDHNEIVRKLEKLSRATLYLTEPNFRGRKLGEYGDLTTHFEKVFTSPKDALVYICEHAKEKDMILITGSLYLIGEIKKILKVGTEDG